jgi:hypothetical protein
MRSISLLLITLLFFRNGNSQVEFSIFAGPQATTSQYKANNYRQSTHHKYGFQAGAGLKVPFENHLYFAPSLFYSQKGYKVTFTQFLYPPGADAKDNNTTFHTLETAFLLQYDLSNKAAHTFIRFGPSLDFQLFGHEKFNTMPSGQVDRNMNFGYGAYGHYSANLLFHFGYEAADGLLIFAQHTRGVTSINNADDGPRIRHRAYGISIGKTLGRNKK